MVSLSEGAVRELFVTGEKPSYEVILQVINMKVMPGGRKKCVLSDGVHFIHGMLATQLGPSGDEIQKDCILRLDNCMKNDVAGKAIIIILQCEVLEVHAGGKIGSPIEINAIAAGGGVAQPNAGAAQPLYQPLNNATNGGAAGGYQQQQQNVDVKPMNLNHQFGGNRNASNPYGKRSSPPSSHQAPIGRASLGGDSVPITPISALNMYNNRWTIKARVSMKTPIRTWSNAKGEGSLFSIELLDSSGMDIRATFFKEAVDQFYNMLEIGSVYRFSGGRLKVANMQYNTCKSGFEITFDQNSEIHLDNDDSQIARVNYDFIKIADIENVPAQKSVDLIAIVKSVSEPANLISKKSGQELTKCDITLVDDSNAEINLTLWGEKAQQAPHQLAGNPVIAVRRARVSDYGGKSLSGGDNLDVSPQDVPEAKVLAKWWASNGANLSAMGTRSLSSAGGGGGKDSLLDRKPISAIKDEALGQAGSIDGSNKADWLSFKATISFIKKDKEGGAWYTACPNAGEPCKNRYKVTQGTDMQYSCEKCGGTFPNCVRRWIFSAVVEDDTSSTWVSFFNEQAEQLLQKTADEIYSDAHDNGFDEDLYESVFYRVHHSEWIFKCKVKSELVNDESRVKTSVYSLHPVDYRKDALDMFAEIAKF